jgi:cell division protein ZapA
MAGVNVKILGRSYRMACEDGEEAHLTRLSYTLETKISELRDSFGDVGDMRLLVMSAIMLADEASDAQRRVEELEKSLKRAKGKGMKEPPEFDVNPEVARLPDQLLQFSARLEKLNKTLRHSRI